MTKADHTKKYMVVDGHLITLSFSQAPNPDLFSRIKSILLSSDAAPHIRKKAAEDDKIRQNKEGA
ncbi:MAG: hypothetical protein IJS45_00945 [Clostridia bacterium]|nr:hypothetical protein [Clostridia bacterium]